MTENILQKKLRHIIDSVLAEYVKKDYPLYVEFVKKFAEHLDNNLFDKILHIEDNVDVRKIYDELLGEFYRQYMRNVIDEEKYKLNDENKRFFLEISKFFLNAKGKKLSFDLVLSYLQNFNVSNENNQSADLVEEIQYELQEPETNWSSYKFHYDGFLKYDNNYTYNAEGEADYFKPYTYRIQTDQPKEIIWQLIEDTNPVGFYPEYKYIQIFVENWPDYLEEFALTIHFVYEDVVYTNLVYDGTENYDNAVTEYFKYDAAHAYDSNIDYIPSVTTNGNIFYTSMYILELFEFTIGYHPVDNYTSETTYSQMIGHDGVEKYDGHTVIREMFEMLYTLKGFIDEFIIEELFAVTIGYNPIDTVEGHIYNNQHSYGDTMFSYGCKEDTLFYNDMFNYNREQYHYSTLKNESNPSELYNFNTNEHPNYKIFDLYELYNAIVDHVGSGSVINNLSDLEACQKMIEILSNHIPMEMQDIFLDQFFYNGVGLYDSEHINRNWIYIQHYVERIVEVFAAHVGWTIDQANSFIWTKINLPTGCMYNGEHNYASEQEWYYRNDNYKDELALDIGIHLKPMTDNYNFLEEQILLDDGSRNYDEQEFYNGIMTNGQDILSLSLAGATPFEDTLNISEESDIHIGFTLNDAMHTHGVYDSQLDYGQTSVEDMWYFNSVNTPTTFFNGNFSYNHEILNDKSYNWTISTMQWLGNNYDGNILYDGSQVFAGSYSANNAPLIPDSLTYDGTATYSSIFKVFYGNQQYEDLFTTQVLCNVAPFVDELLLEETQTNLMDGASFYDRHINHVATQDFEHDLLNTSISQTINNEDIYDDSGTQEEIVTDILVNNDFVDIKDAIYPDGSLNYDSSINSIDRTYSGTLQLYDGSKLYESNDFNYDGLQTSELFNGSKNYDAITGYDFVYGQDNLMEDEFVVNITYL